MFLRGFLTSCDEWNEWHNTVQIPDVLNTAHMRGACKFRVTDLSYPDEWQPQYATVYELDSQADLDAYLAGPAQTLRTDYSRRYGTVGKIGRLIINEEQRFI